MNFLGIKGPMRTHLINHIPQGYKKLKILDVFLMGPSMSEKFVSFFKLVGFSVNLVGNLMGISGTGCQISGI